MISVCLTTYNGEKYIKEQLDSILVQLSEIDEIIISDDGSTDNTLDIIKSFRDKRIRIYNNKKRKHRYSFSYTTANISNALKHASGDIIFLADQDDVWLPDKVKKMSSLLAKYDWVLADCKDVDSSLDTIYFSHFNLYKSKIGFWRNFIGPCCYLGANMCFKKDLLKIFMEIPNAVPHDLWIASLAQIYGKKMYLFPEITMLYRRHDENVSGLNNKVLKGLSKTSKSKIKKNSHSIFFKINYRVIFLYHIIKRLIKK